MNSRTSEVTYSIQSIGIVGAGLMGTGIAESAITSGIPVVLVKATPGDPRPAYDRVAKALARRVERGKLSSEDRDMALNRLTVTDRRDYLAGVDLIIECIVEDVDKKRALFSELLAELGEVKCFATNTSTLRLKDLVGPEYHDRLLGLHFFSPVPAMDLVEVSALPDTRPELLEGCHDMLQRMGKTGLPVIDSAGFVVNRLLVPYLIGSVAAYAQGLASAKDIDMAMQMGCNHPVGPLTLCDLIGLDVVLNMSKLLYREFGDDRFRPPSLLRRMVQDGQLGRKTKLGFYDYSSRPPAPNKQIRDLVRGEPESLRAA